MRNNVKPRFARASSALSLALWLLVLVVSATGCSDKSRRMGEGETLKYKKDLVAASKMEISPIQAEKLMYFPGRTQAEIDKYMDQLKADYAMERSAQEVTGAGTVKRPATGTVPPVPGPPPPPSAPSAKVPAPPTPPAPPSTGSGPSS